MSLNVEIKARCSNPEKIKEKLKALNADYRGCDHQIDTYFKVNEGRLKLREGNIEQNLIQYQRENKKGPKSSKFNLFPVPKGSTLKEILALSAGVLCVVDKQRHIYYIENVKFHVDEVKDLGSYVEIEAGDLIKPMTPEELHGQCEHYLNFFEIEETELIHNSYSDLILAKK